MHPVDLSVQNPGNNTGYTTSVNVPLLCNQADAKCVLFKSHDLNVPSSVQYLFN